MLLPERGGVLLLKAALLANDVSHIRTILKKVDP